MKTKKQNILILSGGGTKGLAHIVVLDKIQKETNENISDIFSSIYASSIGAIISTVFIENKDKQFNFLEKFQNITSDIFQTNFCTKIMNLVCCCRKNPSKYNSNRAENHLEMFFGDQKLRELNTRLVVSAIDNETSTSMFFSADNTPDASVLDAIMCTISAPTYFSPRVFQGREYLDPGFVRNIPIDSLICEIVEEKIDKNNIQVFIVNLNQYTPKEAENTTIPFLRSYIERVCESNRTNDLRILKGLVIEKNIHELSVDFHGDIAMDDTSKRTFDYIHQQAIVSCNENPSFFDKLKDCTEDKLPNESTIDMTNSTLNDTCNMPLLAENQMGTQEESMFQM